MSYLEGQSRHTAAVLEGVTSIMVANESLVGFKQSYSETSIKMDLWKIKILLICFLPPEPGGAHGK